MTCAELRKQTEDTTLLEDAEFWSDSRVSAHVAICPSCSQAVRERQSLRKSLELVRESVGSVPDSLDGTVLAGYRRLVAEREQTSRIRKPYFPLIVGWGVVAALALTVVATVLFSHRKPDKTIVAPLPVAPITIPAVTAATPIPQLPIRAAKRFIPATRQHSVSPRARSIRAAGPIPDDFRGLMYCDQLICDGAMDMIRVQLPSSMIRPSSPFRRASGPVNADVLIGPDGIARGIRIEEREF